MKKILVPTDFSEHAEYALRAAADLAKKNNGEIVLLHMLELPNQMADAVLGGSDIPEVMFFIQKARDKFQLIKEKDYLEGIAITEAVQFERAFDGIIKSSKKHNVDLVIMGSHGASGFQEFFIGSNTEKVVRTSDIPVLVVKKGLDIATIKNVVFASDFNQEIKSSFQNVVNVVNDFGAKLNLLMVNTPSNFKSTEVAENTIKNFVSEFDIKDYSINIYNELNVEKGVLNFADRVNADLIAVCTHGRKGLNLLLNGSISEDIVNHSNRPVITFKI